MPESCFLVIFFCLHVNYVYLLPVELNGLFATIAKC